MKKCPSCEEELQEDTIICKNCGELLNDVKPHTPAQESYRGQQFTDTKLKTRFSRKQIGLIILGFICSGLFLLMRFYGGGGKKELVQADKTTELAQKYTSAQQSSEQGIPENISKGPTADALTHLMKLSIATASQEIETVNKPKDAALQCAKATSKAESYCSRFSIKDKSIESLKQGDYVYFKCRLDYVRPDRYHVTQTAWDPELGVLWDEWVTIENKNYQNAGLWARTEDGRNDKLNQHLSTKNLMDILLNENPVFSNTYRYRGKRYLLIEYKVQGSEDFVSPIMEACTSLLSGRCQIYMWIDLDAGFLAKGELLVQGQTTEGEHLDLAIQQVFVSYNQDIKVVPPPWLNVTMNSKGESIITNTEVPILHHHP